MLSWHGTEFKKHRDNFNLLKKNREGYAVELFGRNVFCNYTLPKLKIKLNLQ
jgi:hypothetical protein